MFPTVAMTVDLALVEFQRKTFLLHHVSLFVRIPQNDLKSINAKTEKTFWVSESFAVNTCFVKGMRGADVMWQQSTQMHSNPNLFLFLQL